MLILDHTQAKQIQLSNDAFYYLAYGEDLLDEDNLDEANEIADMFPLGFSVQDDWITVEDSDLIEATFIPYAIDAPDFDAYLEVINNWQLQITYSADKKTVDIQYWHPIEKPFGIEKNVAIWYKDNKPFIKTKEGSIYRLDKFTVIK